MPPEYRHIANNFSQYCPGGTSYKYSGEKNADIGFCEPRIRVRYIIIQFEVQIGFSCCTKCLVLEMKGFVVK